MNGMYFSGTGNTKYCTEAFAQATGGRACSMESDEALEILRASDEIALGYPIYFSDIPRIVKAFILKHADMFRGKRVFVIATMGLFSGDGAGLAARLLRKCRRYRRLTSAHAGLYRRCKAFKKNAERKQGAHSGGAKKDFASGGRHKAGNLSERRLIVFSQNRRLIRPAPVV